MAFLADADADAPRIELREEISFGRLPTNSVEIAAADVSKQHARILQGANGSWFLEDLSSLNGTWVNGERISSCELREGDEIRIGPRTWIFRLDDTSSAGPAVELMTGGADEKVVGIDIDSGEFLPSEQIDDVRALRRDYERLRLAHEIARDIAGELDPDQFLPRILERSMELLHADCGVILLSDPSGELVPRHVLQRSGSAARIPISRTVLSKALSERKAVLSSDAQLDERFSRSNSVMILGIRSSMTVPLIHGEMLLGAIHLDSKVVTTKFLEKDLELLVVIARQAATALRNAQLASRLQQEAQTRTELQRLIPPNVVEQVMRGQLSLDREGKRSEVTMLFADIRGFTAMSERSTPEEIVRMLNEYYELLVDAVFRSQGTVDKFVGDQIIALFGAPIESADAPLFAVNCAMEMQKSIAEWNRRRAEEGLEPVRIGIGINSGEVITGAIGSSRTLQYTAIGDAMNTAARMCDLAGPDETLISQPVYRRVKQFVEAEERAGVALRGKRDRLVLYRLVGPRISNARTVA